MISSIAVTYWPSTEPSIKRCTCVNKRKNSGSRWTLNNNITSTQTAWVSWSQLESVGQRETSCRQRALRPSMTHGWANQPRWGRSAAMVRRTLGQNNSLSPSPAHLSHTTNINPFQNKVREIYFYKEVSSFVHWSSYTMFDYVTHIFVYICDYTTLLSHLKGFKYCYRPLTTDLKNL